MGVDRPIPKLLSLGLTGSDFGEETRCMRSRTLEGQRVEVRLACRVLNTMTHLGMPDNHRIGWFPLGKRGA